VAILPTVTVDILDRLAGEVRDAGPGSPRSSIMSRSYTPSHNGGRKRGTVTIALMAAAAVVVIGGVAGAVTLTGGSHNSAGVARTLLSHGGTALGTASGTAPGAQSFTAVANVTPPVAATECTTPSTFAYSGTLSATAPGTVKYQWVYSSGQPGPVQTVNFTTAGQHLVTGETVTAKAAGGGWGEIKVISPVASTSNEAAYKLLCGGSSVGGVTVTAAVTPAATTASCATAAPSFTAAGSIKASKAESVTYYWAQSNGKDSAPATLTFTGAGTKSAAPLTITPPAASGTSEAVLVVTSPVTVASAPATYTLTCKAPPASPTTGTTSPTSNPTGSASPTGSPTGSAASPTSTPTTLQPSSPASSGGGTLTVSTTGVTGPWPVNQKYPGSTVTVSGGQAPYTWYTSGLPSGMTATPDGATLDIDGTPTELGNFTVEVTVTDSAKPEDAGYGSLPIEVADTTTQPQTTTLALSDPLSLTDTVGDTIDIGSNATGGTEPYTWTVSGLPSSVTASAGGFGNGAFSLFGEATTAGTYPFTVTLSDSSQPVQTVTEHYTLTVLAPTSADWGVEPLNNTEGTVGTPYSGTFGLDGQTSGLTVTWTITSGSLPPGLSLNSSTGAISGTPTETGLFTFQLVVTDVATGAQQQGGSDLTIYPVGTQT
jgi:large repetitive protein